MPLIFMRPVVATSDPIVITTEVTEETVPIVTGMVSSTFADKHQEFVDQVLTFDRCFKATEIVGFGTQDLYDHLVVALQDNLLVQDGERYCSGQVAYEMKAKTQGYTYKSGLKPQTSGFDPVIS